MFVEYNINRNQCDYTGNSLMDQILEDYIRLKKGHVIQGKSLAWTCGYNAAKRLNLKNNNQKYSKDSKIVFLLDREQGKDRPCAGADGIMLRDGEKQDFQLSAFLLSFSRQMILNLEMLNNYLEEEVKSI